MTRYVAMLALWAGCDPPRSEGPPAPEMVLFVDVLAGLPRAKPVTRCRCVSVRARRCPSPSDDAALPFGSADSARLGDAGVTR